MTIKKKILKQIVVELEQLLNGNIKNTNNGICINLISVIHNTNAIETFLNESFFSIFGNNSSYPIEGDALNHYKNKDKWNISTEFGAKRMKLVKDLLDYANKLIEK